MATTKNTHCGGGAMFPTSSRSHLAARASRSRQTSEAQNKSSDPPAVHLPPELRHEHNNSRVTQLPREHSRACQAWSVEKAMASPPLLLDAEHAAERAYGAR